MRDAAAAAAAQTTALRSPLLPSATMPLESPAVLSGLLERAEALECLRERLRRTSPLWYGAATLPPLTLITAASPAHFVAAQCGALASWTRPLVALPRLPAYTQGEGKGEAACVGAGWPSAGAFGHLRAALWRWPAAEISARVSAVDHEIAQTYRQLGTLYEDLRKSSSTSNATSKDNDPVPDAPSRPAPAVSGGVDALDHAPLAPRTSTWDVARVLPPWYVRLWPVAAAVSLAALAAARPVRSLPRLFRSMRAIACNVFEMWVVLPAVRVYRTVRYREALLAFASPDALAAEIAARDRMVTDYITENPAVDALDGDTITRVMQDYAVAIKRPLREALAGRLVTLLLIQAQFAKVDLVAAMSALDTLMRTNELNFALLAFLPSFLLALGALAQLRAWIHDRGFSSRRQARNSLLRILWRIERAVYDDDQMEQAVKQGFLMYLAHLAGKTAAVISFSSQGREDFDSDLHLILHSSNQKLSRQAVKRIMRSLSSFA